METLDKIVQILNDMGYNPDKDHVEYYDNEPQQRLIHFNKIRIIWDSTNPWEYDWEHCIYIMGTDDQDKLYGIGTWKLNDTIPVHEIANTVVEYL